MSDRPGVLPEDQPSANEPDPIGFYIVVRGTRYEFLHSAIDAEDSFECQVQTGRPVEEFLGGEMSMAALAVMWWLGRRHAGEQHLKIRDAVKQFPTALEVEGARNTDGDDQTVLQVGEILPDSDEIPSPEGSGRKSDPTGPPSPASTVSDPLTLAGPAASA